MSTHLGCSAEKCVNNVNGLCSASKIVIGGENALSTGGTECDSFSETSFTNAVMSVGNTNYLGEVAQAFSSNIVMNPNIFCEAKNCAYNKSEHCMAENVLVNGTAANSPKGTQCETFISK